MKSLLPDIITQNESLNLNYFNLHPHTIYIMISAALGFIFGIIFQISIYYICVLSLFQFITSILSFLIILLRYDNKQKSVHT